MSSMPFPLGSNSVSILIRYVAICLVVCIFAAGCGDDDALNRSDDSTQPAVVENERTVGNPLVFERINSLTSCTALQQEFDIAADNTDRIQDEGGDSSVSQAYMNAANNRMRQIGCYG